MNYLDEFEVSFSEAQTIDVVADAVTYTRQELSKKQRTQARENIGVNPYYCTTREKLEENANSEYIWGLYDALKVQKNEWHSDDGTFTNYEYVISAGDYTSDGLYAEQYGADPHIKKPKYLLLSGIHGTERNAALSAYRFIRDVLNGHNVPTSFKEGATIHIMPVGTPSAIDNFTRKSGNGVDINRNFSSANPEKETQAIANWLKANTDADLYIDLHNNGKCNEVAAIIGIPNDDVADMVKKVAMKGVDRVIPFWKNVIGYPPVEAPYIDENGKQQTKVQDVIFSYSASAEVDGTSLVYAAKELSIPSTNIELSVFYGNYSDWDETTETYPPETIAAGAEVIGNILIEFYEQSLTGEVKGDMKEMNGKLDALMAQVNSGFRMEQGNEWEYADSKLTIKCSPNPKLVIIRADDSTVDAVVARAKADSAKTGFHPYGAIVQYVKDFDTHTSSAVASKNQNCAVANYQNYNATKVVSALKEGSIHDTDNGIKIGVASLLTEYTKDGATVPAVYNWTAYYWNE